MKQLDEEKDISSSVNISVISVELSKEKPKINYTKLWLDAYYSFLLFYRTPLPASRVQLEKMAR